MRTYKELSAFELFLNDKRCLINGSTIKQKTMSLEYIVHGVIVGNRESLEKISQEWNDLSSSNKIDILTESSFDKDDNLRFYGQMRNCIGVAAAIDKFLTDDVKCYRLWGTLDGCCELYTDDFGHKFFNN